MSKIKIYFALLFATIIAYFGSIKYGFSQDDWYFLYISVAHNLGDIINFFNPWAQSGFAFYRPLGTQLYYYVSRFIFGLQQSPYGMHIFMLLIQSLSAYNVYRLANKITKDNFLSILASVVYATSSVHFLSLYYIAATQQLMAALFALLAINDFLENRNIRSAIWFSLGLLSKEVAIVAPIIMILATLKIEGKLNLLKLVKRLFPVGMVGLLYVAFRLFGGLHIQSEYNLLLNSSVLSTLRWYLLFGYGAPEELVRYGLPRMAINFTNFIHDYGWQGIVTGFTPVIFSIYAIWRAKQNWIYVIWWFVALLPVMFLANHRYPHYVDLALVPMILLLLENNTRRTQVILGIFLVFVSLVSINLSEISHWTVLRAVMSESAIKVINSQGYCKSNNWNVMGINDSAKQLSYALSLENGPRVICKNPNLQVYYQGVSVGDIPAGSQIINTTEINGL